MDLLTQGRADARRAVHRQVPARAVRRPAPARRHRPGAGRAARRADRRRAGVHARRVHPARRAQPAGRPAGQGGAGDPLRHPRHRVGPLPRRHHRGDVRRPDGRVRARRRRSPTTRRTPTPSCCCAPRPTRTGPTAVRWPAGARRRAWCGPPAGCRFHPRCPHAMASARRRHRPRSRSTSGHGSACWLYAQQDSRRRRRGRMSAPTAAGPAASRHPVATPEAHRPRRWGDDELRGPADLRRARQ